MQRKGPRREGLHDWTTEWLGRRFGGAESVRLSLYIRLDSADLGSSAEKKMVYIIIP
jgi:hypothetical protein